MARIFTAGNELANPYDEGWFTFDMTPHATHTQRGGFQSTEGNGGEWYYSLPQNRELWHYPGFFGAPAPFPVADPYSELYVRFHFRDALANISGERVILSFLGGDQSPYFSATIYDSGGSTIPGNTAGIRIRLGSTSTIHVTAAASFVNDVWNLFEFRCKLGGAASGLLEVRVNGVVVGSTVGSFLGPLAQTEMAGIQLRNTQIAGGTRDNWYDNIAVNDTSSVVNNSWPGDGYIILRQPHRDGGNTELTSDHSGGENAERIGVADDRVPGTNTNVSSSQLIGSASVPTRHGGFVGPTAVPQKDTYTIKQLPFDAGVVNAISTFSRARGRAALSGNVRHLLKPPAQLEIQGAQRALPTNVVEAQATHFSENPNTSSAFTVTEVNGMELGIQFEA